MLVQWHQEKMKLVTSQQKHANNGKKKLLTWVLMIIYQMYIMNVKKNAGFQKKLLMFIGSIKNVNMSVLESMLRSFLIIDYDDNNFKYSFI